MKFKRLLALETIYLQNAIPPACSIHPRINTIALLDQFQRIQISAKLKHWLLTTIRHYSHHSYYSLFATTVRYSLFGFSRHPNTNECCRRLQALAAASLIQFQLEKKNDPVHLFWMLYRQASRHTKHRTPHTYASFRPRFHDSWPPACLEIVIYAKCIN